MDDETAAAILQLQVEDIDDFLQAGQTQRPDAVFAFEIYREDLVKRQLLLGDRTIARSIRRAVNRDSRILSVVAHEEVLSTQDRQLALLLGGQVPATRNISNSAHQRANELLIEDLVAYNRLRLLRPEDVFPITRGGSHDTAPTNNQDGHTAISTISPVLSSSKVNGEESNITLDGDKSDNAHLKPQKCENPEDPRSELIPATTPSSGGKATLKPRSTNNPPIASASDTTHLESCAGCRDDLPRETMMQLPCEHSYCKECSTGYVEVALRLDSQFPPSCCDLPITLAMLEGHIPSDLAEKYQEKQSEITAACTVMCATSWCGHAIHSQNFQMVQVRCPACCLDTCRECAGSHEGRLCHEQEERERLATIAGEKGWQACHSCGEVVELDHGCNHIQ